MLAWAVAGLMTITGALCCSELATMMPRAGGVYVFLREAYGPSVGFLFGWTLFLVIQTGTIAAVAAGTSCASKANTGNSSTSVMPSACKYGILSLRPRNVPGSATPEDG